MSLSPASRPDLLVSYAPMEEHNNRTVFFAEDVRKRNNCGKQKSAPISISSISAAGWGIRFGHGFALGFKEAKCFAQCLISRVRVETRENKRYICQRSECPSLPAFCVRGEVPLDLDQATNRCGCTAIVLCGVRMKVPEKIFAHSFVEVSCGAFRSRQQLLMSFVDILGPTSFCVDAAGALHQWALSAIGSLEKRYAGDANAWSSWCEGYRDRLFACR